MFGRQWQALKIQRSRCHQWDLVSYKSPSSPSPPVPRDLRGTLKDRLQPHRDIPEVSANLPGRVPHSLNLHTRVKPQALPLPVTASRASQQASYLQLGCSNTPSHQLDPVSYKFHSAPNPAYPQLPQRNSEAQAASTQRGRSKKL